MIDPELKSHLLQDIADSEQSHRVARRVHIALVGFGALLFMVICLAIWASTIRSRVALSVYGDGLGGDEQPTALRIISRDPKSNEVVRPSGAEISLVVPGEPPRQLPNVVLGPETVDAALFVTPEELKAGAQISVRIESEDLEDVVEVPIAAVPIGAVPITTVGKPALGLKLRDARHALKKPDRNEGAIDALPKFPRFAMGEERVEVRLYPESGSLVPVLGNDVLIVALHGGRPRPGVELRIDPPGWRVTTDTQGLASVRLTPGRELGALEIRRVIASSGTGSVAPGSPPTQDGAASAPAPSGDSDPASAIEPAVETGSLKVTLDTPPSQLLARARDVLVPPGHDVVVDVGSVRLRTWLSFEVWYGARLVALSFTEVDGGRGELTLPAPERTRQLVGVRLVRRPLAGGVVGDTAFFYVDDAPPMEAWRHLIEDLEAELGNDPGLVAIASTTPGDDEQARRLMRLVLSRAELIKEKPPLLADTASRNQARATEVRQAWQTWLFGLYWILGIGSLVAAVIAVLLHNRRLFQRLAALDAEEPGEADQTATSIRRRGYLELAAVVIGILFGLYILYLLLSDLWWG